MTTGPKKGRSSKSSPGYVVQSPNSASNNVGKDDTPPTDNSTYPLHQQKGQRRYGPPSDWVEELPRGSEVHVSKLPRDLLEDELIPVFEKVGRIFDIRLMMETPEFNKGYAFVKFCCKEDSEAAIIQLNEYEIRPGVHIVVRRSVDNNRLFIGNIPKNYLADDVLKAMREVTTGVVKVILYASVNDRTKNRGYGFVEFETHQQAKNTRNKLKLIPLVWSGQEIKVDWAEPELEVDEETMKKVRILYVRNLALTTTDQQLRQLFSSYGEVERVKKIKDYAFIHFATREQAEEAKRNLQGFVLDKCEIDISWSKPVVNREEYQQRKAASKALSSGPNIPNAIQATFGLNGEPILLNQRMRTAAGAQGYNASRPYPLRTKQSEETFSALQPPVIYPNFAYYQDISIRNTIDSYGLASPVPPTLYATERVSQMEEFVAPHQEVQYHIAQPQLVQRVPNMFTTAPYNVVNTPGLANCWPPQAILQPTNASPAFISTSPFVVPTPTIPSVPGAYTTQPFYGGQLMTQVPSVTGSNMSIDRT
ncbi:UNVERIFIED_CONTAM: hypothetical protein RMT77_006802 [Armadillidium vulgare]